ncbi:tellurite resistance TerB family protein [Eionea flava]
MLATLKSLLDNLVDTSSGQSASLSNDELPIATAALLIEVATIDQQFDPVELDALSAALAERFSLEKRELTELIEHAKTASSEASSLYQFTQLINQHCDEEAKYQLACELWTVAYADGVLDKHEEHIVRRIADLIHLRHSDFIRSKHQVRDNI